LGRIARAAAVAAVTALDCSSASAGSQVAIGATETIASYNPYADSVALAYSVWCQVLGCLGVWDYDKGEYVGRLAESWEVDKADPNIWTFHLKHGVKRQNDGKEFTAADVVHSFERINSDPQSMQKANVAPVKEMVAVDPYTVKVITKQPTASLLEFLFDRFIITARTFTISTAPERPTGSISGAGVPTSSRSSKSDSASCWRRIRPIPRRAPTMRTRSSSPSCASPSSA
jgi:peptide/nickel transport system substrate-binding protein